MAVTTRTLRKVHRWLGAVIGIQLLAWTLSGLVFSLNPIEAVRGETEAEAAPALSLEDVEVVPPTVATAALQQSLAGTEVLSVTLRDLLGKPVYEIRHRSGASVHSMLADALTGRLRGPLTAAEAAAVAGRDFQPEAGVLSVERVEAVGPGSEYRGGPLPAYRVEMAHPTGARLYVAADSGRVTARRNDRWRLFDLFWMLHIMDYGHRDDFNTWWLQAVAGLGVVTVVSGFVLLVMTSPRLRRWRR